MSDPPAERGPAGGRGLHHEVADRLERWVVPVVQWVRRTLAVPVGAGLLAIGLGVAAALVWRGTEPEALVLAGLVVFVVGAPVLTVLLFVVVLGGLVRVPERVRAAPANAEAVKAELAASAGELGRLRQRRLLGLPGVLRWLWRTLARMDALGVAEARAALLALHPWRLIWVVVFAWVSLLSLPIAAFFLLLALAA